MNSFTNEIKKKDEIEALTSIYGTDFCTLNLETNNFSIEINEEKCAVLEVSLPGDYPSESPPTYSLSAPWLKGPKRKELASYLEEIYLENIGESIIYLWVERIRQFITDESNQIEDNKPSQHEPAIDQHHPIHDEAKKEQMDDVCPQIFSGEIISDRKSHFQPHLAAIHSSQDVKLVLKKLLENKKVASATHNMFAYRFRSGSSGVLCQDCEDDGEANAGKRMLHLLQILEADDVVVVVSRWYGGIQLGPDRFKHINNAARQILEKCGYVTLKKPKAKKSSKK